MAPLLLATFLAAAPAPRATVVLDPGHDSAEPGALGTNGVPEVYFNDQLAAAVAAALAGDPALAVVITRRPEDLLDLPHRAERMNAAHPTLVVSLHHDSVQPHFLTYRDKDGIALPTCEQWSGFSLFAQALGPHHETSLRFASAVARAYRSIGLAPTPYHALKIKGESRKWLDEPSGIYAGDHLFILRKVDAPVVLIESGFVVHPGDEARLSDPTHRQALARAIAGAIREVVAAPTATAK